MLLGIFWVFIGLGGKGVDGFLMLREDGLVAKFRVLW
jgi:hypothetical protein